MILGQDLDAIEDYDRVSKVKPYGYATYTSLKDLGGLDHFSDVGGGGMFALRMHNEHPLAAVQLGLYVVDDLKLINQGARDSNIDRLAAFVSSIRVPVFIRFGYEFDYPENHYDPRDFREAFKHFVRKMRSDRCGNAAFVWHSYADIRSSPLEEWYPGDEFVDWVAISYFITGSAEREEVANFAKRHGKALMIAESAPWEIPPAESWERWFEPLLRFIDKHDVAAWCYINCNWDKIPIFHNKGWGDTRLSASKKLLEQWNKLSDNRRFN